MNQIRFRQIARLEKRALPYIRQREGIVQQLQKLRRGAVAHATVLALLVRYGNLQLGEPLSRACARVTESELWVLFRQKFPPDRTIYPDDFEYSFEPFTRDKVTIIGDALRHVSIATFPGANEKEKLNRVLRSAPPWFLWFTFADYSAKLLGLNLPDLSTVTGFERSKNIFDGWWGLPEIAFECHPWPDGTDGEPLVRTDLSLLGLGTRQDAPITNRERKRALANSERSNPSQQIDWPGLPSEKWLQLDLQTRISLLRKAGHFGGEEKGHPEFCGIDVTRSRRTSDY
jgi:transposase-like protein